MEAILTGIFEAQITELKEVLNSMIQEGAPECEIKELQVVIDRAQGFLTNGVSIVGEELEKISADFTQNVLGTSRRNLEIAAGIEALITEIEDGLDREDPTNTVLQSELRDLKQQFIKVKLKSINHYERVKEFLKNKKEEL